ncbi:hypothetical protein HJFPF1_02664 [Paramyrothecium foliicola]|nr:hypothetical protein HJFPF1_02664 [Paramyrothecium foliicola]
MAALEPGLVSKSTVALQVTPRNSSTVHLVTLAATPNVRTPSQPWRLHGAPIGPPSLVRPDLAAARGRAETHRV